MVKTRSFLTACAMFVALISFIGLLCQASEDFLATIGLQPYSFLDALAPDSRTKLMDAALRSQDQQAGDSIGDVAKRISAKLRQSPADAELWTSFASLLVVLQSPPQQISDALKMSYFAAPADFDLMSERSRVALVSTPMSDQVLQTLAEGDIRAILLKQPALAEKLIEVHQRAPQPGKAFLMRAAGEIAPEFATRLLQRADTPRN